jgi:hypothetical protein
MEYRLLIDLEVIEIMDGLPKKVRKRLLDQFLKIRSFPTNYSDYPEQDAVGRRVEICILSGWAIHYWIDFADRQVKVLCLKSADK